MLMLFSLFYSFWDHESASARLTFPSFMSRTGGRRTIASVRELDSDTLRLWEYVKENICCFLHPQLLQLRLGMLLQMYWHEHVHVYK